MLKKLICFIIISKHRSDLILDFAPFPRYPKVQLSSSYYRLKITVQVKLKEYKEFKEYT